MARLRQPPRRDDPGPFIHDRNLNPHRAAHFERAGLNEGRGGLKPDPNDDETSNVPYFSRTSEYGIYAASGWPYQNLEGAAAGEEAALTITASGGIQLTSIVQIA